MRLINTLWLLLSLPLALPQDGPVESRASVLPDALPTDIPSDWFGAVSASIQDGEYHYNAVAGGAASAPNRSHGLRSWIRSEGIEIAPRTTSVNGDGATWHLGLRTTSFGRVGDSRSLEAGPFSTQEKRASIDHGPLVEWFINDERGIEQGWTIASAPRGEDALPVWIGMESEGDLQLMLGLDGQFGRWVDAEGIARLRYSGLRAWDANGKDLPARIRASQEGFGIEVSDAGAQYPITVDPFLTGPAWTTEVDQVDAEYGFSASTAGDVNGDGYSDVVVGAHLYDNGDVDEGAAFVYHGSAAGLSLALAWSAESDQFTSRFGEAVCSAGDVNGDGYDDVIVGAPFHDNIEADEGRAFVYHGSASGLSLTPDWTTEPNQAGARHGLAVSTAGDVNDDGFADVIVGAPRYDAGENNEGRASVYLGSGAGLATSAAWTAEGNQIGANFGASVATAGDVDGDGFADVLVGAFEYDTANAGAGLASVYLGGVGGPSTTPVWSVMGSQLDENLGNSVHTAGDVDGDGYADIIVGSPFFSNGESSEGKAGVFHGSASGPSAVADWEVESDVVFALMGLAVSTAGDVDGDGYADVVVGAPLFTDDESSEGRATVYLGGASGLATTPDTTMYGNQVSALFGNAVATAGDVNGDGFSDLIVGARSHDNGEMDEGRAYVFEGSATGLDNAATTILGGDQDSSEFGYSVSTAGDVDADGYSDVIVGARSYDNGEMDEGRAFVFLGGKLGLLTVANWTAESDQIGAFFGHSVSVAGDVNGDGYSDVIVGAPDYDNGELNEGRAYTYLGSSAGVNTTAAWTAESDQIEASYAQSVADAGDVNDDGYGDVIVGCPDFDNGNTNEGKAEIFYGSSTGLSTSADWSVESNQGFALFGWAVNTAGDVNADGFSDVVVGSVLYDNGENNEGAAFAYHGSASGPSTTADWTGDNDQSGSLFGVSVASAGDVNGDGYSDLVVGSRFWSNPETNEGAAFVYHGSASGLSLTEDWTVESNQANAELGVSVDGIGDANGDGYGEVVLGSPLLDLAVTNEGGAVAYKGSATGLGVTTAWIGRQSQAGSEYGFSVAGAGDVNGDGFADVIVGARAYDDGETDEGAIFVYEGNDGGSSPMGPTQRTSANTATISLLGRTDSESSFRLQLQPNDPNGKASSPAGRTAVWLEWEIEPLGTLYDGAGLGSGTVTNSGPVGGILVLNEMVTGLTANTHYKWRVRVATESPFFPHTRWLSIAWNAVTESKLATINDCNSNSIPDEVDIAAGTSLDCNSNGIPDECDVSTGTSQDCNSNSIPDECDVSSGASLDCNSNGIPDECETDCNANSVPDDCDISSGTSPDCNSNSIPDECDINAGTSLDCNSNGVPDDCEPDCNGNNVADECDITSGTSLDCNSNGVPDDCDISSGTSQDCNSNAIPDDCEPDCNGNNVADECDISGGTSLDCNVNGVPDECEPDCNSNFVADECDISSGTSQDCNLNGVPDSCDIGQGGSDCNSNGVPDECEPDCNSNGVADECETDCNGNGVPDDCDISSGTSLDCNSNAIPDDCEADCNANGVSDDCDISSGASTDTNMNLVPDDCELVFSKYCLCAVGPCGNSDPLAGCANSTGGGAVITGLGTGSVGQDDLGLRMGPIAPNQFGLFYVGTNQLLGIPFGDGLRCVGGLVNRFPPASSGATDEITIMNVISFGNPIFVPTNLFAAGSTWNFQGWYRDSSGPCSSSFNLTDAISITLQP